MIVNGTELKEGKFYKWSGHTKGYINDYAWKNTLCKILSISGENVRILEVFDGKIHFWTKDSLNKSCNFKKLLHIRIIEWFKIMIS